MKRKTLIIGGVTLAVLAIGGIAAASGGKGSAAASAAPTTVTVTAPAPAPKTVTVTAPPVTAPPVTVTVTAPPPAPQTVTAQPDAPTSDPAGPKKDGTYVVGAGIAPGNWQCAAGQKAGGMLYWRTSDNTGEIIDNGVDGVAFIGDDAFSVWLDDCAGTWTKVG